MNLTCREIVFGSPLYHTSMELRKRVLRTPLGLDWEPDAFAGEEKSFHIGVFSEEQELLGCLVLKPLDATQLKMRQVAIEPKLQGRGIGAQLISFSERFALEAGYRKITAHVRQTAVPFYRKLRYSIGEDSFLEVSIPHYLANKDLP